MYDPQPIQDLARQLNESANSPNPNFKIARKVAAQLLTAIRPQVTAALAAPIYAYYLRSTDLIVSDDPLLLRKHRYVDAVIPLSGKQVIELPEFFASSEGAGSHFVGGFGEFALIAGHAAAAGFHQGGQGAEAMMAAQIAALRSARWDLITEQDQRLAALRILAAREWIVRSATHPQYLEALTSATLGILSLSRRADLLNSIADHDWNTIWKSVPLPDLYTLGSQFSRYALSRTESSPVFVELHALESAPGPRNIDYLARIPNQVDGCSRLHMSVDAPYEEYARHLMQEDLAQRTADFKLYLASRADNAGVQPSDVGRVAEKLAARAFAASQLTDYHDWRSLFAAYSSITTHDLEKALQP